MPHERGFWGHAGVSFGQSKLQIDCPSGFSCDDTDQVWKAYVGGRFNNIIGLEFGLMHLGKFAVGGGETEAWGGDASIVAGIPIGANSSIFGKVGLVYARTEVSGVAPDLATGVAEDDWGARWGIGAQLGLTPNWSLRADYDRYRLQFPGSEEDIDALTLGVQYTFR
jgi:opacity protein-like surface antigen